MTLSTWPSGVTPKNHYSSPKTAVEQRKKKVGRKVVRTYSPAPLPAHADHRSHRVRDLPAGRPFTIVTSNVMLEAKGKDVALLALRKQLRDRGLDPERDRRMAG